LEKPCVTIDKKVLIDIDLDDSDAQGQLSSLEARAKQSAAEIEKTNRQGDAALTRRLQLIKSTSDKVVQLERDAAQKIILHRDNIDRQLASTVQRRVVNYEQSMQRIGRVAEQTAQREIQASKKAFEYIKEVNNKLTQVYTTSRDARGRFMPQSIMTINRSDNPSQDDAEVARRKVHNDGLKLLYRQAEDERRRHNANVTNEDLRAIVDRERRENTALHQWLSAEDIGPQLPSYRNRITRYNKATERLHDTGISTDVDAIHREARRAGYRGGADTALSTSAIAMLQARGDSYGQAAVAGPVAVPGAGARKGIYAAISGLDGDAKVKALEAIKTLEAARRSVDNLSVAVRSTSDPRIRGKITRDLIDQQDLVMQQRGRLSQIFRPQSKQTVDDSGGGGGGSARPGGLSTFARYATRSLAYQLPGPVGYMTGGGMAAMAGGVVGALGTMAIRKVIQDYTQYADEVRKVGIISQATAKQSSTLLAIQERLGGATTSVTSAMQSLRQATQSSPEQFEALGIALKNADGSARPLIDVFEDVRQLLARAKNDSARLQIAQELLGGSYEDLIPLLALTDGEYRRLQDSVSGTARVMGEEGLRKAMEYKQAMDQIGFSIGNMAMNAAQVAIPALVNLTDVLGQTFDAFGSFLSMVGENNMAGKGAGRGAFGILNPYGNNGEVMGPPTPKRSLGDMYLDAVRGAAERADAKRRERESLAASMVSGGGVSSGPSLADATRNTMSGNNQAAQDAIRKMIEREKDRVDKEIKGIRKAQEADQFKFRGRMEALRILESMEQEAEHKRDLAREHERINGTDTISLLDKRAQGIRDIMAAEDDLERKEAQRKHLADAEKNLTRAKNVQIFRTRGELEEEYSQRVYDNQQRIKQATEDVENARKDISKETRRDVLEAELKAIAKAVEAEQKRIALERLNESERSRERQKELEKRLDEIGRESDASRILSEQKIEELQTYLDEYTKAKQAEIDVLTHHVTIIKSLIDGIPDRTIHINVEYAYQDPNGPKLTSGMTHDYPHSLTLPEPTALLGLRSGKSYGIAALKGSEELMFGGVGRSRAGVESNGGMSISIGDIHVTGGTPRDIAQAAAAKIEQELEREFDRMGQRGYVRR
jgi:hypothetical protein